MRSSTFLTLSSLVVASAHDRKTETGAFVSVAGSVLNRGASDLVDSVVLQMMATPLPGHNDTLFWIDPVSFEDVSVDEYGVSVLADQGVQVSLKGMSNKIAKTKFCVHDLFNWVKCTGEIWGSGTGASYTAMNTLEVDEQTGLGKLVVNTPKDGFDAGVTELHHQMDGRHCEKLADIVHLVDGVVIDLVTTALEKDLAGIINGLVAHSTNKALALIEFPPPLGIGKEKFQLDNSFVSANYDNNRITHFNAGQFQSTLHPQATKLHPPALAEAGERDIVFSFSDYTLNTLFESMYAEHIGETMVVLPLIKTLFDEECHHCPLVIKNTFDQQGQQSFMDGAAAAHFTGMKWEIGALQSGNIVLPLVDLSVNATLGITFELEQSGDSAALAAQVSLQKFEQDLLVSHIGDIDLSDLTRDIYKVALEGIGMINAALQPLVIPAVPGTKMANEKITTDNRELRVEADVVLTDSVVLV